MTEIVAFLGVIGGGKDHQANKLTAAGTHVRVDFKDGLLRLASDIVGYDVREDYDWVKEHVIGVHRPNNPLSVAFCEHEWQETLRRFPDLMTGRKLLTRLGTEGMRKRDEDYWAKQFTATALAHLSEGRSVVNADCRFMNEVRAIKSIGVPCHFVFCDYRSSRYNPTLPHESEALAQSLLDLGLRDGEVISDHQFAAAAGALAK